MLMLPMLILGLALATLAILFAIAAVLAAAIGIAGSGAFTTWLFAQLWAQKNRSRVYFFAALNSLFMFLSFLMFTCWTMWEWRDSNSFIWQGLFPWACTIAALACIFLHAAMGATRQLCDHLSLPLVRR